MDTSGDFAAIFQREKAFAEKNLLPYYLNNFKNRGMSQSEELAS